MTDYDDYENNLAFPPTTDSTSELVEKIEKLTKENKKLKQLLEFYWGELGEYMGDKNDR